MKVFSQELLSTNYKKAGCTIAAASTPERKPEVGVSRVFIFAPINLYNLYLFIYLF